MTDSRAHRAALAILLLTASATASSAVGQAPPGTDIWLMALDLEATPPTVTAPRNVTDREGYDNQPHFAPEGGSLLYTSQRDGQTDIYKVTLEGMVIDRLTDTAESEYSATVLPSGHEFAVIRVEDDGAQRLWAFRRDGSAPRLVLENVAPVGYQAWTPEENLVMFVLGEPATLQLANLADDTAEIVATDIGRSLHALPDNSGFSFLHRVDGTWRIRSYDLESGVIGDLGLPFEDAQDMAWTPDGRIIMASGSRLALRSVDGDWVVFADLAETGVGAITRLAVHPEGAWLAAVGR
jgi:WD40 repeat protein